MTRKYEAITIVAQSPEGEETWNDRIFDFITSFCDEEYDPDKNECSCGMETMSGSTSDTVEGAYDWLTSLGKGLQPIDVAYALVHLFEGNEFPLENLAKVMEWARDEIEFEERWANWTPEEDEEE